MTNYGPGWHTRGQGGTRGSRGVPGRSRLPLAAKWVIKTAKNGPKPWFKVSKVYPDPKRMVLIHFWGILGHLDALQQRYLVKMSICQKNRFHVKKDYPLTQVKRCNFLNFSDFSQVKNMLDYLGKLSKTTFLGPWFSLVVHMSDNKGKFSKTIIV